MFLLDTLHQQIKLTLRRKLFALRSKKYRKGAQ